MICKDCKHGQKVNENQKRLCDKYPGLAINVRVKECNGKDFEQK